MGGGKKIQTHPPTRPDPTTVGGGRREEVGGVMLFIQIWVPIPSPSSLNGRTCFYLVDYAENKFLKFKKMTPTHAKLHPPKKLEKITQLNQSWYIQI